MHKGYARQNMPSNTGNRYESNRIFDHDVRMMNGDGKRRRKSNNSSTTKGKASVIYDELERYIHDVFAIPSPQSQLANDFSNKYYKGMPMVEAAQLGSFYNESSDPQMARTLLKGKLNNLPSITSGRFQVLKDTSGRVFVASSPVIISIDDDDDDDDNNNQRSPTEQAKRSQRGSNSSDLNDSILNGRINRAISPNVGNNESTNIVHNNNNRIDKTGASSGKSQSELKEIVLDELSSFFDLYIDNGSNRMPETALEQFYQIASQKQFAKSFFNASMGSLFHKTDGKFSSEYDDSKQIFYIIKRNSNKRSRHESVDSEKTSDLERKQTDYSDDDEEEEKDDGNDTLRVGVAFETPDKWPSFPTLPEIPLGANEDELPFSEAGKKIRSLLASAKETLSFNQDEKPNLDDSLFISVPLPPKPTIEEDAIVAESMNKSRKISSTMSPFEIFINDFDNSGDDSDSDFYSQNSSKEEDDEAYNYDWRESEKQQDHVDNGKNSSSSSNQDYQYNGNAQDGLGPFNPTEISKLKSTTKHFAPWLKIDSAISQSPYIHLHNEILRFASYISPLPSERQKRETSFELIENVVKRMWPNSECVMFGSITTKLALPSSDIDISIFGELDGNPLNRLSKELRKSRISSDILVIRHARVPIIKLVVDRTGVQVDICFNQEGGPRTAVLVRKLLKEYVEIKPLTLVVKYFLAQKKLNDASQGGFGSFLTFLMVLNIIQQTRQEQAQQIVSNGNSNRNGKSSRLSKSYSLASTNLGVLLLRILDVFGRQLNFREIGISVLDGGSYFVKRQRGWSEGHTSNLSIENPDEPDKDVGKASYATSNVRDRLARGYMDLVNRIQGYKEWVESIEHEEPEDLENMKLFGSILSSLIYIDSPLRNRYEER